MGAGGKHHFPISIGFVAGGRGDKLARMGIGGRVAGERKAPQRQARGRVRIAAILDAADRVVARQASTAVSLQEVAQEAGLPVASVYHYFATPQALLIALAQRYLLALEELAAQPLAHEELTHWADIARFHARQSIAFYNAHPVAMRLLFGPESGGAIRAADQESTLRVGRIYCRKLAQHFAVEPGPALEEAFAIAVTLSDAVWALSFARHGCIEAGMAEEAMRARLAYLRLYVGEFVARRAVAKDQ
jgi:AcrR family transcriptional regulator